MRAPKRYGIGRWLLGFVLAAVLVDCGLRLIEATPLWRVLPVVQPSLGHPNTDFGFEHRPGAYGVWPLEHRARVGINTLGLRDIERTVAKPPGVFRVGLLGDSMTEALQVEQPATFAALAEHALQVRSYRVELINLAIAGPNPLRALLRLELRGYQLDLDLIVVNTSAGSFTAGSLLDDSENPAYAAGPDGDLVRSYRFRQRFSQRIASTTVGHWLFAFYQDSPLLRMLYLRGRERWRDILGLGSASAAPAAATVLPDPQVACRTASDWFGPQLQLWRDHQPQSYWRATAHFLDELAEGTRTHRVRAIYAIRDIILAPADCASASERRAQLVAIMSAEFARRGMQFVDWTTAVAKIAGAKLDRLRGFGIHRGAGHLNYDGHRAWSTALVNVLQPKLPQPPK